MTAADDSFCFTVDPNKVDKDVVVTICSCWYNCGPNEGEINS